MFRHGSSAEPPGSSGTPIAVPFQPTTRVGLSGFAEDNAARERRAREAEVKAAQASNARTQEQTRQLALERREQDRQKLVAQKAKGDGKDRERTDREVDQYRETDKKQRQNKKAAEEGMRARLSASPVKTALPRPGTKMYGSTGVHKQFKVPSMTSVGGNGPVVMKGKGKAREEEEEDIDDSPEKPKPYKSRSKPNAKQVVMDMCVPIASFPTDSDSVTPEKPKQSTSRKVKTPPRSASPENIDGLYEAHMLAVEAADLAKEDQARKARRATQRLRRKKGEPVLDSDDDGEMDLEDGYNSDSHEALLRENAERERAGGTPDPLLQREAPPPDPTIPLCPFCSRPLPRTPSARLLALQSYLLALPQIRRNPTLSNPGGMTLSVVETTGFCRLHEDERTVIPEGLARGWPSKIDFDGIERRLDRKHSDHLQKVIMRKFLSPFFVEAKQEWEDKGARRMENVIQEWGSFEVEMPGYYGDVGLTKLTAALTRLYITLTPLLTPVLSAPLSVPAYTRRVLIPEATLCLIAEDLNLSREEAEIIKRESGAFGKAVFGGGDEEEEFRLGEKRRRKKELEEAGEKRKKSQQSTKKKSPTTSKVLPSSTTSYPEEPFSPPRVAFRKPKKALQNQRAKISSPPRSPASPSSSTSESRFLKAYPEAAYTSSGSEQTREEMIVLGD